MKYHDHLDVVNGMKALKNFPSPLVGYALIELESGKEVTATIVVGRNDVGNSAILVDCGEQGKWELLGEPMDLFQTAWWLEAERKVSVVDLVGGYEFEKIG